MTFFALKAPRAAWHGAKNGQAGKAGVRARRQPCMPLSPEAPAHSLRQNTLGALPATQNATFCNRTTTSSAARYETCRIAQRRTLQKNAPLIYFYKCKHVNLVYKTICLSGRYHLPNVMACMPASFKLKGLPSLLALILWLNPTISLYFCFLRRRRKRRRRKRRKRKRKRKEKNQIHALLF